MAKTATTCDTEQENVESIKNSENVQNEENAEHPSIQFILNAMKVPKPPQPRELLELLEKEEIPPLRAGKWTKKNLAQTVFRLRDAGKIPWVRKRRTDDGSDPNKASSSTTPRRSKHSQRSERFQPEPDENVQNDKNNPTVQTIENIVNARLEERITELEERLRERFAAQARNVKQDVHGAENRDEPPKPTRHGHKENRLYEKFNATLDTELCKRFKAECDERNISAGRLLDKILWHWYGQPRLSYMTDDNVQNTKNGETVK
jgi:hypothetical protein